MQINLQEKTIFSTRLRAFIRKSGFRSVNEFSHHLGYVNSEKINRIFRNPQYKPSYETIYDIAIKFPKLSIDWLITGRGHMFFTKMGAIQTPSSTQPIEPEKSNDYIPLYDIISASDDKNFWDNKENIIDLIPKKFGMRDADIAIYVYGNSMCPLCIPGDITLLKEIKNYNLINYGQMYVIITEEHRLMKYIMHSRKSTHLLLHSEHKHYEDIELPKKQVLKLYQVQGFFRKMNI